MLPLVHTNSHFPSSDSNTLYEIIVLPTQTPSRHVDRELIPHFDSYIDFLSYVAVGGRWTSQYLAKTVCLMKFIGPYNERRDFAGTISSATPCRSEEEELYQHTQEHRIRVIRQALIVIGITCLAGFFVGAFLFITEHSDRESRFSEWYNAMKLNEKGAEYLDNRRDTLVSLQRRISENRLEEIMTQTPQKNNDSFADQTRHTYAQQLVIKTLSIDPEEEFNNTQQAKINYLEARSQAFGSAIENGVLKIFHSTKIAEPIETFLLAETQNCTILPQHYIAIDRTIFRSEPTEIPLPTTVISSKIVTDEVIQSAGNPTFTTNFSTIAYNETLNGQQLALLFSLFHPDTPAISYGNGLVLELPLAELQPAWDFILLSEPVNMYRAVRSAGFSEHLAKQSALSSVMRQGRRNISQSTLNSQYEKYLSHAIASLPENDRLRYVTVARICHRIWNEGETHEHDIALLEKYLKNHKTRIDKAMDSYFWKWVNTL